MNNEERCVYLDVVHSNQEKRHLVTRIIPQVSDKSIHLARWEMVRPLQ